MPEAPVCSHGETGPHEVWYRHEYLASGCHNFKSEMRTFTCYGPKPTQTGPDERACAHGVKPWKACERCFITEPTP